MRITLSIDNLSPLSSLLAPSLLALSLPSCSLSPSILFDREFVAVHVSLRIFVSDSRLHGVRQYLWPYSAA